MIAQKLRGLVGQGMSGGRKSVTPVVYNYPAGSYTFTVPKNGWYRFYALGGGGGAAIASSSAGSGALVVGDRALVKGQTVALVIGVGGGSNTDGNATTVTFPDGGVMMAGAGISGATTGAGGAASSTNNLDTLYNGSAKAVAGGGTNGGTSGAGNGGGSPGVDGFRGGNGGTSLTIAQRGAGGYQDTTRVAGGDGEVLIHQIRLRP